MNETRILHALGGIDPSFIEEAAPSQDRVIRPIRKLSLILLAAVLAAVLLGCGIAAGIFGDSIQSWFAHHWEADTGQPMTDNHAALIDHLSQEINLSQTVDGVTVTLDSATVGDDSFAVLLRVSGLSPISKRHAYEFRKVGFAIEPEAATLSSWGLNFLGIDGDDTALFMLEHDYTSPTDFEWDPRPLHIEMHLTDLGWGFINSDKPKIVAEGTWDFSFTLDHSTPPQVISLPDTAVTAFRRSEKDRQETVLLTNMELTSMGLRYQYVDPNTDLSFTTGTLDLAAFVILENGLEIRQSSGSASVEEDRLFCSYHWYFPVDLSQVVAIRFGDQEIPVPR